MVMRRQEQTVVTGRDGLRGVLETESAGDAGDGRVLVRLDDGRRVSVRREVLVAQADGSYLLNLGRHDIEAAASQRQVQSAQGGAERLAAGEATAVPIIEEHLRVEKQTVESGRVAIRITPREREEVVDLPLVEERVEVERVPVNRVVTETAPVREEGDVTIIPVYEEVLVVEKRLVLKEEVRLTRRRTTTNKQERVTLRSEEVTVLRPDEPAPTTNR